MEKLEIYKKVQAVPDNAKKTIVGGRLRGMTDINPMWRIQALTEQFGPCGIGWYYEVTKQWLEPGAKDEVIAFVNINLYIKIENEWSKPIFGTGGNSFIANESKGLYTSDECYKMALTDAISVACKTLGFGADVYWQGGQSKYDKPQDTPKPPKNNPTPEQQPKQGINDAQVKRLYAIANKAGYNAETVHKHVKDKFGIDSLKQLSKQQYDMICNGYESKVK